MKSIKEIIGNLRVAMTDARQNESHFESWMILNEAICNAIEALADQPASKPWVGLTDAEIQKEFHPLHATGLQFARSIEAKLKEKNT